MTIHLVTFASNDMSRSAELCVRTARQKGADNAYACNRHGIEFSPWADGPQFDVLALMDKSSRGGGGWWCWKPFIVADTMWQIPLGDILIYSDAGIEFINNVNHIIDRMDQDIFLFGNNWEHAHWCKADIVAEVMPEWWHLGIPFEQANGDVIKSMSSWAAFGKQAQASVIFFRVSDYTRNFVREWLDWCLFEGGRLIDDSPSRTPNHPEFRENRHDQAILTTMAYRDGLKLHYWPASYNDGAFNYEKLPEYAGDDYPVLFNHHRRRNHELGASGVSEPRRITSYDWHL